MMGGMDATRKEGKTMDWTNEEEEWWRQGTHAGGVE